MTIRGKSILFLSLVYIVFMCILLPFSVTRIRELEERSLEEQAQQMRREVQRAVSAKSDVWLTNALQLANNIEIQKALEENRRTLAVQVLTQYGDAFRTHTNFRNVRVHIVNADLFSFVKSWDPEAYGESMREYPSYAAVAKSKEAMVTMEYAASGLRLKGLFPIISRGTFLGIINFEGGLNSIKRDLEPAGFHFLYALHQDYIQQAESLSNGARIGDYYLSQRDYNEEYLSYAEGSLDIGKALEGYVSDGQYLSTAIPVKLFDGSDIGIYIAAEGSDSALFLSRKNRNTIVILSVSMGALILILIVFGLLFLEFNLIRPVGNFQEDFQKISRGELNNHYFQKSSSYLSELNSAADTMLIKMQNGLFNIHSSFLMAEESQEKLISEIEKNLIAANTIAGQSRRTRESLSELNDKIRESDSSVKKIDESISMLARQSSEQSSAVSQSSAAVEEMSASIRSITDISEKRWKELSSLQALSQEGEVQVHDTVETVEEVGDRIKEVLELTELISHITGQTNLLSMNAAIEAAHAGEHGKGFAVVADEIRKLAESTRESSARISKTLTGLGQRVENAVASSRSTGEVFERIRSGTGKAVDAFREISQSTRELELAGNEMNDSSSRLLEIAEELAQGSATIKQEMGSITALMENVDETAVNLGREMKDIQGGATSVNSAMEKITVSSIENCESYALLVQTLSEFQLSEEVSESQERAGARLEISKLLMQHAAWVSRARGVIDGSQEIDVESLSDHHSCDLGRWLQSPGSKDCIPMEDLEGFKQTHKRLHEIIKDIVSGAYGVRRTEALFDELVDCSRSILATLSAIRDRIDAADKVTG